jgi:hypothetical protein
LRVQRHYWKIGVGEIHGLPTLPLYDTQMPGPQGIITVRADFQGAVECSRGAIQTALTAGPSVALPAQVDGKPVEEDFTIPSNESPTATSMRPTKETKRINLRFSDERKTVIISSSLDDK